jgi:hypothetical protein
MEIIWQCEEPGQGPPAGPCRLSCPVQQPGRPERWCDRCRAELERHDEECAAHAALSLAALEADRHLPASREEWLRYLDDIAPLAR